MFTCVPYTDAAGEHRWRVVHDNGRIVADSAEGYTDRRDRDHMMHALFDGSATVVIVVG